MRITFLERRLVIVHALYEARAKNKSFGAAKCIRSRSVMTQDKSGSTPHIIINTIHKLVLTEGDMDNI